VAYAARVLLDSISPAGIRLTTLEVTFPRFVLAEFNTHRQFSRNSASSRAIPSSKMIERVERDPVLPLEWGRNQKGMSASELLSEEEAEDAKSVWLTARDAAVAHAKALLELKVHKQVLNRVLEPFLWHTVIVTGTEWNNFFELRCAPTAQPEIREAALRMRDAMIASTPRTVGLGKWHLPLVQDDERNLDTETLKEISAARCARVSYLTHDGTREIAKDLELFERLKTDRHLSPFEHVATPTLDTDFHANLRGWIQMRAEIEASAPLAERRASVQIGS
jgi:thymidylate synthase ThyX